MDPPAIFAAAVPQRPARPENPRLLAQILIVTSLLGIGVFESAPSPTGQPWMVGSMLSAEQPHVDIAPRPPDSAAPWYSDPSALPDVYNNQPPQSAGVAESLCEFFFPHVETLDGYYDPFSRQFAYGSVGVQSYRLGWFSYDDFVFMPNARASVGGNFQNLEWNTWLRYSRLVNGSMVFSWSAGLNGKFWTGPTGIGFPPDGDQLISDFQFSSNRPVPWNWQLGVTPQIASDFSRSLNSNAFMCDARAVLLYRPAAEWTIVTGVAFWNRASDHLIPYGGLIWAPNNRWEFRLTFPRSRVSYYAGNHYGFEVWGYISGEYNLEAYQFDFKTPHVSVRGELSDYRFLKGFNFERGRWNFFWEGGAVLDRHVRFRGAVGDFGINEGLVIRTGITY